MFLSKNRCKKFRLPFSYSLFYFFLFKFTFKFIAVLEKKTYRIFKINKHENSFLYKNSKNLIVLNVVIQVI